MLVDPRPKLAAFRALLSNQEDEEGLEESSLPALRRGNRIMDDAASSGSESEDDAGAPDPPSARSSGTCLPASASPLVRSPQN